MTAPTPMFVCVDMILFSIKDGFYLTIRRKNPPFAGAIAFPGGYVDPGEDIESAAYRELEEEAGVRLPRGSLNLLGQWSNPDRDPRGRVVSLVFYAKLHDKPKVGAGDDAASASWRSGYLITHDEMAFDHFEMLKYFMRTRLDYNGR